MIKIALCKDRERLIVTLEDAKYVTGVRVNLMSIRKAIDIGFNIQNERERLKSMKKSITIYFDTVWPEAMVLFLTEIFELFYYVNNNSHVHQILDHYGK
jgi:hypothetical protein